MKIVELLAKECILLDIDVKEKEQVWGLLAECLQSSGAVTDVKEYLEAVRKRETLGTTGVGFGVAIPHAESTAVTRAALAMAKLKEGVDVASLDGSRADLFFLIAAPLRGENVHLQALSKLARMLVHDTFLNALRAAKSVDEVLEVIQARDE